MIPGRDGELSEKRGGVQLIELSQGDRENIAPPSALPGDEETMRILAFEGLDNNA